LRSSGNTAEPGEGEDQSKDEPFHRRLPVQQPLGLLQAATGVLLKVETAMVPPTTASAMASARASVFIGGSRFKRED
jgi:hypothetical protein